MPKVKSFIDRKNCRTFELCSRSQRDPLLVDPSAPQHVLVETTAPNKEEERVCGIFFEDDYNYLKHLKNVNQVSELVETTNERDEKKKPKKRSNLRLPASVFQSHVEEKIGLLHRYAPHSGPRVDLDPEVFYKLDNPDEENDLEDNIIELGGGMLDDDEDKDVGDWSDVDSDEARDEVMSLNGSGKDYDFANEETKSRFTEYSMTSSVMRRNSQLTLLDDKFENMYKEYDEDKVGSLDFENIEGPNSEDSKLIQQFLEDYQAESKEQDVENMAKLLKERCKVMYECSNSDDEGDSKLTTYVETEKKEEWDCESILSTYSNIYNHPKKILEPNSKQPPKIAIDRRTGIPQVRNIHESDSEANSSSDSEDDESTISTVQFTRSKHETSEEKKERKRQVKAMKNERRREKKMSKEMFKEEKKKEQKVLINKNKTSNAIRIA
ncbi:protein LTV1 homolog [Trichogramma pretiosum]|uniref:protein LTV1 homolog n=1 Tax=Trichogramma pretiosum TaxID=7493 RepID=UPI0006C94C93|nr:protein LTV1 homolog [Trichogramma pretiosum]